MTINEIPNIEHCTVTPMVNGGMFKIQTHEGWYLHLDSHPENSYTTVVILLATYDFSTVHIIPASELPPDAEINGNDDEHEVS